MTESRAPMVGVLGAAVLLSLTLLGIAAVFALLSSIDELDHARYGQATRRALELDARLSEEVAKSHLGIVAHYDDLVRVWDAISATNSELDRMPEYVSGGDLALLEARLEEYRESLEREQDLVERFKTDQAVLRNSLRALPHNIERLLPRLENGDVRETLEALLRDSMLLVAAPTDVTRDRAVRCDLARLGRPSGCDISATEVTTLPEDAELASVIQHAEIVLARNALVTEIVDDLMSEPVSTRAQQMRDTYSEIHRRAARDARVRWLLVFVAAIAFLVLAAAFIIVRLQSSALALQRTKGMLEVALVELKRERDHEVELAGLKSRFVSMTSHEFRTPLSVILSSAELIEAYGGKWDDARRRTHLGRIQDAAKGMSRMLDGVLLIGRAEAGMLELNPGPVRPAELAAAVVEEVRSVVGPERKLDYSERGGSEEMWLDENLLRHVLTNLLSNAFKYSPTESTVRFAVRKDGDGVIFEVEDEGIGIPEDERAELFEAFHRCSNASAIPGTGLGLAVVKKSVEVHRGTIEVDTEVGRGARFAVRVPNLAEAA